MKFRTALVSVGMLFLASFGAPAFAAADCYGQIAISGAGHSMGYVYYDSNTKGGDWHHVGSVSTFLGLGNEKACRDLVNNTRWKRGGLNPYYDGQYLGFYDVVYNGSVYTYSELNRFTQANNALMQHLCAGGAVSATLAYKVNLKTGTFGSSPRYTGSVFTADEASAICGVPVPCPTQTVQLTTTSFPLNRSCKYQISYKGEPLSNEDEQYQIDTRGFGDFYGPGASANSKAVVTRYIYSGGMYSEKLGANMEITNLRWNGSAWMAETVVATAVGTPQHPNTEAEGKLILQESNAYVTNGSTLKFIHWLEGDDGSGAYSVDFSSRGLWGTATITQSPK